MKNKIKEIKTKRLIWELTKRSFKKLIKVGKIILQAYKSLWNLSRWVFLVFVVLTLISGFWLTQVSNKTFRESIVPQAIEYLEAATQKLKDKYEIPEETHAQVVEIEKSITPEEPKVVIQPVQTSGVEQWRPLVAKYFPANQVDNCLAVMRGESGGNHRAYSYTADAGLMQINTSTWCGFFGVTTEQLFDPETNIRLARVIWDRAGGSWRPWTVSRKLGLD